MTTTNESMIAFAADTAAIRDSRPSDARHPDLIRCMTAMRDLARYIADAADHELNNTQYPDFYCAFLDDDSDYMPAALDMMNELMIALTDDDPDFASTALLDRIRRNDIMLSDAYTKYTDLPLDAAIDLPFSDID